MVKLTIERRGNADEILERIAGNLEGPLSVKVGFPAGEADADIVARAVWNEFGTRRGVPERPFLRNAMRSNREAYRARLTELARLIVLGGLDLSVALRLIGTQAQGDIQKEIVTLAQPPNAPSTIARKGSSNPLIDTGEMRQKVTYKVGD